MNGLLHVGMEILNSHAQAVEAHFTNGFKMRARGDARIDFNADFAVGSKLEMLARETEEIFNLLRGQISRRAAAPMELDDGAALGNAVADAFHFALEHAEIRRGHAFVFLDDDVAGPEKAQAVAK